MSTRLKNYLSCFGPQFVSGITVIADKAGYERRAFRALTRPYPNFFELAKLPKPANRNAHDVRMAVWGAIVIAWIFMITLLAMVRISLSTWIIAALIVSIIAPRTLLGIAALCLRKARRGKTPTKPTSQR